MSRGVSLVMNKKDIVQQIISQHTLNLSKEGMAYAPSNIALVKYWGKRDKTLNLPRTGSLSISLGDHGTETTIQRGKDADRLFLNEQPILADHPISTRLFAFLDLFRPTADYFFDVYSDSRIPIGAGLASSASGFASMVLAMNRLLGVRLDDQELSVLARMGSGSAARSLFHGFVEWHGGERDDGMDSYAEPLPAVWPEFRIGLVPISDAEKPIGSTDAMNRTVAESVLYEKWPTTVESDLVEMKQALEKNDFTRLGEVAESNALIMHATMLGCRPSICYWLPETMYALQEVWQLRKEGVEVYATIDAGPNVKLLFETKHQSSIKKSFEGITVIDPFTVSASLY